MSGWPGPRVDPDHRCMRLKWLLVGLGVLSVASVLSWPELEYVLFGKTVEAEVVEVREVVESQRRSDQLLIQVSYRFDDQSHERQESDRVPVSWQRPEAGKAIAVQYLPGRGSASRLAGHYNIAPLALLVVILGAVVGFLIPQVIRGTQEPAAAPRN